VLIQDFGELIHRECFSIVGVGRKQGALKSSEINNAAKLLSEVADNNFAQLGLVNSAVNLINDGLVDDISRGTELRVLSNPGMVESLLSGEALVNVLHDQTLQEFLRSFRMLVERFVVEMEVTLNDVSNDL
jgi:hypothetical protein